jgi:hypothetical protein
MFIHRPDFNARAWMLAPFLVSRGRKPFFERSAIRIGRRTRMTGPRSLD